MGGNYVYFIYFVYLSPFLIMIFIDPYRYAHEQSKGTNQENDIFIFKKTSQEKTALSQETGFGTLQKFNIAMWPLPGDNEHG